MYCNIPLTVKPYDQLNLPDEIPSDVKVRIRVKRNFSTYASSAVITQTGTLNTGTTYYVATTPVTHNGTTYNNTGDSFMATGTSFTGNGTVTATPPLNGFNPMYRFGTGSFAAVQFDKDVASDALSMINVVPNPYYAFSSYEQNQLDNRVKIVNLPPKCTITILTQSGTLVKQFKRDARIDNSEGTEQTLAIINTETSVDWDMKNTKGIPVASGVYLIHIDAGELGQRTLKWFGMLRPIDLDTF